MDVDRRVLYVAVVALLVLGVAAGLVVYELYFYEGGTADPPHHPASADIYEEGDVVVVEFTEDSVAVDELVVEKHDSESGETDVVVGFGSDRWENLETKSVNSEEKKVATSGGWFSEPSRLEIDRDEVDGRLLLQYVEDPPDGVRSTVEFKDF